MAEAAQQELQCFRHGAEVGAEVDGVGDRQQSHRGEEQRARVEVAQVRGDALIRSAPDAGTDLLDHGEHRKGEEHGPGKTETELRTGLAVGGNAAGIVVGGSGDQPRPEKAEW